jgi:hypothetical protein
VVARVEHEELWTEPTEESLLAVPSDRKAKAGFGTRLGKGTDDDGPIEGERTQQSVSIHRGVLGREKMEDSPIVPTVVESLGFPRRDIRDHPCHSPPGAIELVERFSREVQGGDVVKAPAHEGARKRGATSPGIDDRGAELKTGEVKMLQ